MESMTDQTDLEPISPSGVRYIKLGKGGEYERYCLENGIIRLGFNFVPHEPALAGDLEEMRRFAMKRRGSKQAASNDVKQIADFYTLDDQTLWITFIDDHLYWCFTGNAVTWVPPAEDPKGEGYRIRRVIDAWHRDDICGKPLKQAWLSGNLTQVAAYQGSLCSVQAPDYLIRKINHLDLPEVSAAKASRTDLLQHIQALMTLLTWKDFELLVDLVFSGSGWRRTSEVGGTQKTIDIGLELPSTGETAFVQVKSKTSQKQFDDYLGRFDGRDEQRMFYVYHTGPTTLTTANQNCTLIGPAKLSEMILQAGLFDWLLKKVQ
jgi:hypothetical protein